MVLGMGVQSIVDQSHSFCGGSCMDLAKIAFVALMVWFLWYSILRDD